MSPATDPTPEAAGDIEDAVAGLPGATEGMPGGISTGGSEQCSAI
jgi:hypothetical protein